MSEHNINIQLALQSLFLNIDQFSWYNFPPAPYWISIHPQHVTRIILDTEMFERYSTCSHRKLVLELVSCNVITKRPLSTNDIFQYFPERSFRQSIWYVLKGWKQWEYRWIGLIKSHAIAEHSTVNPCGDIDEQSLLLTIDWMLFQSGGNYDPKSCVGRDRWSGFQCIKHHCLCRFKSKQ